jgi:hypothetical protein
MPRIEVHDVAWANRLSDPPGTGLFGKEQMTKIRTALDIVVAVSALALMWTPAFAYSQKVKDACSADYGSLCAKYKQGSSELRRCFESNRRVLSTECVQALVDAGEVPARYLKERR